MEKYIDSGLYNVDLSGTSCSEFSGMHPTLIIQTKYEKDIFFVIPLTSYTREKWEKLKKYMCCRIKSTNSIARVDKIQVINSRSIRNRWKDNKELLQPTYEEINSVFLKAMTYFETSLNLARKKYVGYLQSYETLKDYVEQYILNYNALETGIFAICFFPDKVLCSFDINYVNNLSIVDILVIFSKAFREKNITVQKSQKNIEIYVEIDDEYALTMQNEYDRMCLTEG